MLKTAYLVLAMLITLTFTGCSAPKPQPIQPKPKVVLAQINFDEEFAAYEKVWAIIQADNDNLKNLASVQPYDEAQLAAIKNSLQIMEDDMLGLNKINIQVAIKIESLKKALNSGTKAQSRLIQNKIKENELRARMENGRVNAVLLSAQTYVKSMRVSK